MQKCFKGKYIFILNVEGTIIYFLFFNVSNESF